MKTVISMCLIAVGLSACGRKDEYVGAMPARQLHAPVLAGAPTSTDYIIPAAKPGGGESGGAHTLRFSYVCHDGVRYIVATTPSSVVNVFRDERVAGVGLQTC